MSKANFTGGGGSRKARRGAWRLLVLAGFAAACDSPRPADEGGPATAPPIAFDGAAAAGAAAADHGRRLAAVLGCRGCHGATLEGKKFYEFHASNLTRDVAQYDDARLERLLREGKRIDGRDLWAMPSEIFQHLSAPDMAALIFYLRTLRPAGAPTPPLAAFGPSLRADIARGKLKPAAAWVRETRQRTPVDLGPRHALGRYVAMVTCAECHNARLEGHQGDTPDLIVAGTYSRDEFEALIRHGKPNGPRKLGLMADVAGGRFVHLTPREADALHAYLKARAERPQ